LAGWTLPLSQGHREFKGSRVQRFKGSKVQGFKGSRVQGKNVHLELLNP
jgi:hypothetical protein